jgi:uncharacterized protein YfaA (DUF2138 family)
MSDSAPRSAPPDAPLTWRARIAGLVLFLLLVGLIFYAARWSPPAPQAPLPERSALQLDLARPDALIESASLARLPKDLLRVPLLRDALSEDFVFYYRSNADRLGIVGSLRRIAYEHDLQLQDSLLEELLDRPAQIALWRGSDGKLAHALLRIQRGALARTLQPLAQVAADDRQLGTVGTLDVDGDAVPVLRLRYNADRAILLIAHDDDLLVLTSPQMLQAGEGADAAAGRVESGQLARLLGDELQFAPHFGLEPRAATHRIVLTADYLALGYGRFVPQFAGVRVDMDDAGWRSWLALDRGDAFDFAPLWRSMPAAAAACAAAPVSADALRPLYDKLAIEPALASRLGGPVALCWYGGSRLHTPLIVTQLQGGGDAGALDGALGAAFERVVGTSESDNDGERFEVLRSDHADGARWQRVVGSRFGGHAAETFEQADRLYDDRYFRVTLARRGDVLLFSLDDALVDKALATLERRFPPLAEELPNAANVPVFVAPSALAALLEQETLSSLPADVESVFRNAAERNLLPKLRALGAHQRFAVTLPQNAASGGDWHWVPLEWTPL